MTCTLAQTGFEPPILLIVAAIAVVLIGTALVFAHNKQTRHKALPLLILAPLVLVASVAFGTPDTAWAAGSDCPPGATAPAVAETTTPTPTPSTPPADTPLDCAENGIVVDGACVLEPPVECNEGESLVGGICVPDPKCVGGEIVSAECVCPEGSVLSETGECYEPIQCGPNEEYVDGGCECPAGYERLPNGNCVSSSIFTCPAGEVRVPGACVCPPGEIRDANGFCGAPEVECPVNEVSVIGACECRPGYERHPANGSCLPAALLPARGESSIPAIRALANKV